MGANFSYDEMTTTCTPSSSNRQSAAYEPTAHSTFDMSASAPSLRPPSCPPRANSAPASRLEMPTPTPQYKSSTSGVNSVSQEDSSNPQFTLLASKASPYYSACSNGPTTDPTHHPTHPTTTTTTRRSSHQELTKFPHTRSASSASHAPLEVGESNKFSSRSPPVCCSCRKDVDKLTTELIHLRAELSRSRDTVALLQEKEKILKDRLSEQARRQLEKGTTVFEDISLGNNRPTQLIRRYGNLYAETRLDALDALDELIEVAQFKNLKGKLLLSVVVLAFRNARRSLEETKVKVKQLLHIPDMVRSANSSSSRTGMGGGGGVGGGKRKEDIDIMIKELDDVISMYLRKTIDQHNLTKNYEEVCAKVWKTLYDFPNLRHCRGLLRYIDECVRLAWALAIQNPPLVIDYEAKNFDENIHTRFHSSDADSTSIKCVLWPVLREGDGGACLFKGVVIT